jgi:hypothetical protein
MGGAEADNPGADDGHIGCPVAFKARPVGAFDLVEPRRDRSARQLRGVHRRALYPRARGGTNEDWVRHDAGTRLVMRVMFFIWTTLITTGIVYFAIVGLTHG